MSRDTWTRYLVAAVLVLLAGSVWVLAEEIEMKVEVRNHGGQEITVDVNGVKEIITLDDLAEGEERTFDVGGHQIVVRRADDQLMLVHDGDMKGHLKTVGESDEDFLWVTSEGDCNGVFSSDEENGKRQVMIVNVKEIDGETATVDLAVEPHVYAWKSGSGEPVIIKEGGPCMHDDVVMFRCEDTGSLLVVKKDENLLDSYIDPVTGCVMEKVDTPQHRVKILVKEREEKDDGSDD